MKIKLYIIVTIIAMAQPVCSQETYEKEARRAWFDFEVVQHFGLSGWGSAGYVDDGLPGTSVTEIRGKFNVFIIGKTVGAFADMGVGIMPASDMKSFDLDRMPMPHSGTQYYLREMTLESGSENASAHFKTSTGLFADFQVTKKLSIMPYLGIGIFGLSPRSYEMVLKEQGSNMQYDTEYVWAAYSQDSYGESQLRCITYLSGRVNAQYKLASNLRLLFGLEYTHFFDTVDFRGKYTNTFNANIQRKFTVEGNRMNMLGLSVGISFR